MQICEIWSELFNTVWGLVYTPMKILNSSPLWTLRRNKQKFNRGKVLHFRYNVKKIVNPQMMAVKTLTKHPHYRES